MKRPPRKRLGRPPKPAGEKAQAVKVWLTGKDAAALAPLAKAKHLELPQYVLGLIRDDLARAAAGAESGPVTDAQLLEVARNALALAESWKSKHKGGKP